MEKIMAGYNKAVEMRDKQVATIERHEKQLAKKVAALVAVGLPEADLLAGNVKQYKWGEDGRGTQHYWPLCEVESKQDDIKRAKHTLVDRERIVEDWAAKMTKANARVEQYAALPAVIVEFGEKYKARVIGWYEDSNERVKEKLTAAAGLEYKKRQKVKAEICKWFGNEFLELARMSADEFATKVEVLAERRKMDLIELLVARVKEITGEITDAAGLHIGMNGEINGLVIGEQGKANVNTIGAGGYNIQCFHFRVLVKAVK